MQTKEELIKGAVYILKNFESGSINALDVQARNYPILIEALCDIRDLLSKLVENQKPAWEKLQDFQNRKQTAKEAPCAECHGKGYVIEHVEEETTSQFIKSNRLIPSKLICPSCQIKTTPHA